jgi:hypothetical protein
MPQLTILADEAQTGQHTKPKEDECRAARRP